MIVRFEPWGAWVKLETEPALLALDRDGVRALGLDGGARWKDDANANASAPIEVHVAVTSRCAAGCEGCYLDARPDGEEPPRDALLATLDALRDAGVFTVAFGGGEPTLRDDLGLLAAEARARGITPVVTTSGLGLGPRKIDQLRAFAQVNVSYDGPDEAYARVRGFDGAADAEEAIARLAREGIAVGVNVVLTRATFDRVRDTVRRARALGAREVQLLRYKPAGRARSADYLARRLSPSQGRALPDLLRDLAREHDGALHIRIDCALVPFFSADPELAAAPERLARWGVLGCEAGSALASTRVDGRVAGCSFASPTDLAATDLARGWADAAGLAPFRDYAAGPPEPCASCTLRSICRGGCKVVAEHVDGAFGPDPECPRVREHRARKRS
ncbi:MAG TPA: radical SAM protein [Labilithrix sp.]|jgi:radical SAM protein with 4Fe4S-binding SPASM domain